MTWAPIDTAPKPLKPLLIDLLIVRPNNTSYRVIDAWFDPDAAWVVAGYLGTRTKAPERSTHKITHWMHRPDDPAGEAT